MRTIPSAITTGETSRTPAPVHRISIYNPVLSFGTPSQQSNSSLETAVPQSIAMRSSGNLAYVTYRATDGSTRLRVCNVTTASDWALALSGSATVHSAGGMHPMRCGVFTDLSGNSWIYSTAPSGSGIRVRRGQLTGTSNPLSYAWNDVSPVFGSVPTDTSAFVRRVEAVCPTEIGVIVAIGEHDFTNSLSTITFWYVPDTSTAVQLNALIQMPLTDGYSNWYSHARHCAWVCAAYDGEARKIVVVANASAAGRAVTFTVQAGAESSMRNVLPIDSGVSTISFAPASLSSINGLHYLTGRMTRRRADGVTLVAYDGYLTRGSDDFSIGERNHFVQMQQANGALLMPAGSSTIYYAGNLYLNSAAATPAHNPAITGMSYPNRMLGWSLSQVANNADQVDLTLHNADGALTADPLLRGGRVARLESGQETTYALVGEYSLEKPGIGVTTKGREPIKLKGLAIGDKSLAQWKAPMNMQLMARSAIRSDMAANGLDGLLVQTPQRGYSLNNSGLVFNGLNEPFIAFADEYDHGDGLTHVVVQTAVSDAYHLSTIGVLIGASDAGQGNLFVLPKAGTWGADTLTGPQMRRLRLNGIDPTDPDKDDTGWNFKRRTNGLVKANTSGNRRSDQVLGSYSTNPPFTLAAGTRYGVAVRTSGRRAQLYTRTWLMTPSQIATNAQYVLRSEFLFGYDARKNFSDTPRSGMTISTDVHADVSAFEQSAYDDIEQSLTDAGDNAPSTAYNSNAWACQTQAGFVNLNGASAPTWLTVGAWIRLSVPSYVTHHMARVMDNSDTNITISPAYNSSIPAGTNATVYTIDAADEHGHASSGKKNLRATEADELGDLAVYLDPGAQKRPRAIYGRALFVSDDGTAAAPRYVVSDGVRFSLRSGSSGTRIGWDHGANPLPEPLVSAPDYVKTRYGGSDPSRWRVIFHHGYIFGESAAAMGLPASGYMIVDDEIVRYEAQSFYRRGWFTQTTWTIIPAYYAALAAASGPTSVLRNWRSNGGAQPGDDLGLIPNAVGLLVEVSSRGNQQIQNDKQYYVAGQTYVISPTVNNTSSVTLDKPYENDIAAANPDTTVTPENNTYGDVAILSGRGQFGTTKAKHDSATPVAYCPVDSAGNVASVTVSSYRYFGGLYQSLRDVIARVARLAGVRDIRFRTAFAAPYQAQVIEVSIPSGSPYTLPAREPLIDFMLRMNVFISDQARLNIYFRDYYRLTLRHFTQGVVLVGLATTRTTAQGGVDADASGDRWLAYAYVPLQSWLSTAQDDTIDITVAATGEQVVVEVGGQHLWTFDLALFTDGTNSYSRQTAGAIQVEYSAAQSGNLARLELVELSEEMGDVFVDEERSALAVIDDAIDKRRVLRRAMQSGGCEWSQFWTRDDAGTLRQNLLAHNWTRTDRSRVGHRKTLSDRASGEALDVATIQTDGYEYASATAPELGTPAATQIETRLQLREDLEFAEEHQLSGYGRLAVQPEDGATLQYDPNSGGSDLPSQTALAVAYTQVHLTAVPGALKARYMVRLNRTVS